MDLEKELYLLKVSEKIEVIVKYVNNIDYLKEKLNANVEDLGLFYSIISLQKEKLEELSLDENIIYIEFPKRLYYSIVQEKNASCINNVYHTYNLTGEGVLVSIIDSGIDIYHSDFIDNNGNSRIISLWDQSDEGKTPLGFSSGREYTNDEINALINETPQASRLEIDTIGHGTAVAGIACGNGNSSNGINQGIAPKSSLLVVKLGKNNQDSFALTTDIMRAIKYSYNKAIELKMPLVINLSFGTNDGSHEGNTLFETYLNAISETWKSSIVAASGNEGFSGHHFQTKLETNKTIDIPFSISPGLKSIYITFWKNFVDDISVELIHPSSASAGLISNEFRKINKQINNNSIFSYYGLPNHYNEKQEIYFNIKTKNSMITSGIWILRIHTKKIVDGNIDVWLPTVEEVGRDTAFSNPTPIYTLTIPSTASNVISVGGYNSNIDTFAVFSGQGNIRDTEKIKPDLVAPSVDILTTKRFGGYDTFTGTSMAAPFVTGSVALMLEWGIIKKNAPFLYGQKIKAFLQNGARRDDNITYPNIIWGYGKLCLENTMKSLESILR